MAREPETEEFKKVKNEIIQSAFIRADEEMKKIMAADTKEISLPVFEQRCFAVKMIANISTMFACMNCDGDVKKIPSLAFSYSKDILEEIQDCVSNEVKIASEIMAERTEKA